MKLWPVGFYRVSGESMLPTYRDGDLLLGWRWFVPKPGQVVVAHTPERYIIKRVKKVEGVEVWLEGDNTMVSTDSRSYGPFNLKMLEARVIIKV